MERRAHMDGCENKPLLPREQDMEQLVGNWTSKDVIPVRATTSMGCEHSSIPDGSTQEPAVSKGSNDISCSECSSSNSPPVYTNVREAISNKRLQKCLGLNLSNEQILVLVARHTSWNPHLLCSISCVCKKMNAVCNRILWREFCLSRAPKMVTDLLLGAKAGRIDGGWQALGKLLLYCAGCCHSNISSRVAVPEIAGHFMHKTRFSQTSGHSFLLPRCRKDVLYMSDPCEHVNDPEDVGLFRGVFRNFDKSETKKLIIANKRVQLEAKEKCPYCKTGGWSMGRARMIPRSASTRLAAFDENVDYFICLNGHVSGRCMLLHLSDTDASDKDE